MKNFLKTGLLLIMVTLFLPVFSQITIKGGLNLSNMTSKDDDDTYSDNFKMKPGFHLGFTTDIKISDMATFETGLLLMTKGYKASEKETYGGQTYSYEEKASLLYLDIPILAKAYFDVQNVKAYGAIGPYIGIGLSGKTKWEGTGMGESDSGDEKIKWGSGEDDHLKRLDYGLSFGIGIEKDPIVLGVFYNLGLANIAANTDGGTKIHNKVLGISIGVKLPTKK